MMTIFRSKLPLDCFSNKRPLKLKKQKTG